MSAHERADLGRLRPARHVIFDLDGVLLDTEPLYTRATQAVIDEYGKVFDWAVKGDMIGKSSLEGARYLVQRLNLPISAEAYLARRAPLLDRMFPEVDELPGARAFVEALARRDVPMAVATSGERALTELKLTRHGAWFSAFRAIVHGDDPRVGALKPAPDIFLVAASELDADPASCLVFEDSLAGVAAARAAGMQVVALPDPEMDASRYSDAYVVVSGWAALDAERLRRE